MDIKISKTWAMPNSKTFRILPIKSFVERYISGACVIVDPFANDCKYGTITNDLNPEFDTDYHMDALDFLRMLPDESADVVLYDPPYSLRQVSECYKGVGREVTMETTQRSWRARHLDEIARVVKHGGVVLCFGWNSAGVGKKRGFQQVEILLVAHGGSKNDTICSAEIKTGGVVDKDDVIDEARQAAENGIEYKPVQHGYWIEENGIQICSECGEEHDWDEYRAPYCETCGAKMDKKPPEVAP